MRMHKPMEDWEVALQAALASEIRASLGRLNRSQAALRDQIELSSSAWRLYFGVGTIARRVPLGVVVRIADALGLHPAQLLAAATDDSGSRPHPPSPDRPTFPPEEGPRDVTALEGPAAPPQERLGLSGRQAEVAALLARGLTNQEVARRLGISRRTVDAHVQAIYRMTPARNRTELAVLWRDA